MGLFLVAELKKDKSFLLSFPWIPGDRFRNELSLLLKQPFESI